MTTPSNNLVSALVALMSNEPKFANKAVTGACCWPPVDHVGPVYEVDCDALAGDAANQAYDLEQARTLGVAVSEFRLAELYAAEIAFMALEDDYRQERIAADEAYENRPGPEGLWRHWRRAVM